jgi:hypothetical protein
MRSATTNALRFRREITPRMTSRVIISRPVGLALVVAAVLARSALPLYWGDVYFNADHATTGLMAKHIAEGRAFPVMQYGAQYVLVLEAWLTAPLMLVADNSLSLLAVVPVVFNALTAILLYLLLTGGETPLRPALALFATLPVALPSVSAADELSEPIGMNIEPLFFTLVLWLVRERPVALGVAAAVGIKNREFVLYAVAALLFLDLVRNGSAALWRPRIATVIAFAMTWTTINVLTQRSTPLGPGTTMATLGDVGGNMSRATGALCFAADQIPHDVAMVTTELLPFQFGLRSDRWRLAGYPGAPPPNLAWLWWPLVMVLAIGALRGIRRLYRREATAHAWLGTYLVLVGLQAVIVYAGSRCGNIGIYNMRYMLLSVLAASGAIILTVEGTPVRALGAVVMSVVGLWLAWCLVGHAALIRGYLTSPPENNYSHLAAYLEEHGIGYVVTDYWVGYQVAFRTSERVRAATQFDRVHEHLLAVDANMERAVEVRRSSEGPCEGAVAVGPFYVCALKLPAQQAP